MGGGSSKSARKNSTCESANGQRVASAPSVAPLDPSLSPAPAPAAPTQPVAPPAAAATAVPASPSPRAAATTPIEAPSVDSGLPDASTTGDPPHTSVGRRNLPSLPSIGQPHLLPEGTEPAGHAPLLAPLRKGHAAPPLEKPALAPIPSAAPQPTPSAAHPAEGVQSSGAISLAPLASTDGGARPLSLASASTPLPPVRQANTAPDGATSSAHRSPLPIGLVEAELQEGEAEFQDGGVEAKLQEGGVDAALQEGKADAVLREGGVAELQKGEVGAELRTGGLQTELQQVGEDAGGVEAGLQKDGPEGGGVEAEVKKDGPEGGEVEAESQNVGAEAEDGRAADGAEMSPDATEPAAAPPSSAPGGDGSTTVEETHSAEEEEARAEPTGQICFVLGGPGSGATTQSMKLAAKYGYTYCGVYKLLQLEVTRGSRLAREFSQFVMSGKVVPMRCYADLLAAHIKSDGRYIVDDFPRTPDELTLALRRLRPQAGARDFCIWLDAPEDLRGERLISRGRSRIKPPPRAPPPAATDAGEANGRAGGEGVNGGGAVASLSYEAVESQVLPPASRDEAASPEPEPSEDGHATGERCREARAASTISAAARGRQTRREFQRRKEEAISREKRMLGRDHPTVIRKRLDAYRARAASLKEHLESASLVLHVDAAQPIESVFTLACDAFEKGKMND